MIWIAPKDELAAKEKANSSRKARWRARAAAHAVVPAQLRQGRGSGAEADRPDDRSGGGTRHAIQGSPRGSVIFETRTNQLFVTDIPSKLEEIQMLIRGKIDVPVRQVLIEARIVIADDTFSRSLGVKLGATDLRGIRGGDAGYRSAATRADREHELGGNMNAVGPDAADRRTAQLQRHQLRIAAGDRQNGYNPATRRVFVAVRRSSANRFLNLEISAIEADGRGKVVSSRA